MKSIISVIVLAVASALFVVAGCNKISKAPSTDIMFYLSQDCGGGPVSITINGVTKQLKVPFTNGQIPNCGDNNTVSFSLAAGSYTYTASDSSGSWSDQITVVANVCNKVNVQCGSSTPIDPTDANGVQNALIITGGTLKTGNLPTPGTTAQCPMLSYYQSTALINPGSSLIIPFNYSSFSGCSKVYLQVNGATNGYFEITGFSTALDSGTIQLPIAVPNNMAYGQFCISYLIVDNNGNYSNLINTCITISAPVTCSDAAASGSAGLTFTKIQMNSGRQGLTAISYNTYTLPDRIDVYQGKTWLTGTGSNPNTLVPPQCNCDTPLPGFVGQISTLTFNYDSTKGKIITVVVSGCLGGGGTAWDWSMTCP